MEYLIYIYKKVTISKLFSKEIQTFNCKNEFLNKGNNMYC